MIGMAQDALTLSGMIEDALTENDPAKAEDNRWVHRPAMDWSLANGHAQAGGTSEGLGWLRRLFT